ncbi:MAG: hypothetical protein U5L98_16565 [Halomonas sp.]|uniref:hypothetical protein n=1 Tax=Halomonas sp. TaxID=1486246 RepID=UPI002ACDC363|nr:hypothetical protein [Halomonas sp.]MDZ7854196.1 hypothetical protein [Halomonas sp.]
MISLVIIAIIFFFPLAGYANEPIKRFCETEIGGIQVRFVGQRGDLIEVHDTVNRKHYRAYQESRADMDGAKGELGCGDVFSGGNLIVIRTGRKNDYVQIYGVSRNERGIVSLYQYRWKPLDHTIDVTVSSLSVARLRNGRKRNRFYTVCWDVGSRSFMHSVAANQFTGGHLKCNKSIPRNQVRHLELSNISQDLPAPPPPIPEQPAPQITGYRLFCQSGTGTGNIEYWGRGFSCDTALNDARNEISRQGGCLQIGSNYLEIRREKLNTSVCR